MPTLEKILEALGEAIDEILPQPEPKLVPIPVKTGRR